MTSAATGLTRSTIGTSRTHSATRSTAPRGSPSRRRFSHETDAGLFARPYDKPRPVRRPARRRRMAGSSLVCHGRDMARESLSYRLTNRAIERLLASLDRRDVCPCCAAAALIEQALVVNEAVHGSARTIE